MCPDDTTLLRLLAGELPDAQRDFLQSHLAQCSVCRQRHASLQATWDQLGQWQVTLPSHDLTGAILAAAGRESLRYRWYARGGIAAALLVAAGVGWTAGRWPTHAAPTVQVVSTDELAEQVGLDALSGDLSAFDNVLSIHAAQDNTVQEDQL